MAVANYSRIKGIPNVFGLAANGVLINLRQTIREDL